MLHSDGIKIFLKVLDNMEKWEFFAHTIDIKQYTHTFEGEKSQSSTIIKRKLDTPPPPCSILFLTADIDNVKENTSTNSRLKESGKY